MNKHWRNLKAVSKIALNIVLILALTLPRTEVQASNSYHITFEESKEEGWEDLAAAGVPDYLSIDVCTDNTYLPTRSLFLYPPYPPLRPTTSNSAIYEPTSGPYVNWNNDYNFVTDGNWITERRYEGAGERHKWEGFLWGFEGFDGVVSGCGWIGNEVVMYSSLTNGQSDSIKIHRRKFTIPIGEYVTAVSMNVFADDAFKLYINGKPYNLVNDAKPYQGHSYGGNLNDDFSPFVAGKNLMAFSVYNISGDTGAQYYFDITTVADSTPPTVSTNLGPVWYQPNTVLTVSASDNESNIAHTYASYDGFNFYRADSNTYDKTNTSISIGGATRKIYNYPTSTDQSIPASDRSAFTTIHAFNTFQSGQLYCLAENRAGRWSNITSCGYINTDNNGPMVNFNYEIGSPLTVVASFSDQGGSGISISPLPTFTATNQAGQSLQSTDCNASRCTITVPPPGGRYTLSATVRDNVGNQSSPTATLNPENIRPSNPTVANPGAVPTNVPNNTPTNVKATFLNWGASTDTGGSELKGYNIAWQTVPSPITQTGFVDTPTTSVAEQMASGRYYLFAQAVDKAGNKSDWVNVFTYIYDIQPPNGTVQITETGHDIQSGGSTPYNIGNFIWDTRNVTDNFGPLSYDVYFIPLDPGVTCNEAAEKSEYLQQSSSATTYNAVIRYNQNYCLRVIPKDAAGNPGTKTDFYYVYAGGKLPYPNIVSIAPTGGVTPLPSNVFFDYTIDQFGYKHWSILYGKLSSGHITVTARTGGEAVGYGMPAPAESLTFPALFGSNQTTYNVPTTPIDYRQTIVETSANYIIQNDYQDTGAPHNVTVLPSGVSSEIKLIKEISVPNITGLQITAAGNAVINGDTVTVGPATTSITVSMTIVDPDKIKNGHSFVDRVECPGNVLGNTTAPTVQRTVNTDVYSCTYSVRTLISNSGKVIKAADNFGNESIITFNIVADNSAPDLTLDVPDHPGPIIYAAWTGTDPLGGIDYYNFYKDNFSQGTNCPQDNTVSTLISNAKRLTASTTKLELANDGSTICIQSVDRVGNVSKWKTVKPGLTVNETLYYAFDRITAVERRDSANPSNSDLTYSLSDHIGSVGATIKADGSPVTNVRYLPFGQERWTDVDMPTDLGYTGQRNESGFGLMDYKARYYSPALGRFISPDTIIPNPTDSQSWDRYAYTSNNPVNATDSSGHCIDGLTTVPCLVALIAVVGFAGGAANYQYNVSGHSWWESKEDAVATFNAGMEGSMAAVVAAELVVQTVVTGNAAWETVENKFSSSFSGLKALPNIGGDPANFETPNYPAGTFSIRDWSGYPEGSVPQPSGPFRLLSGDEYEQARKAADQANRMMHGENPSLNGLRIHEIQPVKFGGSPTDPANKIALPPSVHAQYTNWWNQLQRKLEMK